MYVYTLWYLVLWDQKRVLEPLGVEVQIVSHHVGVWDQTLLLCGSSQSS